MTLATRTLALHPVHTCFTLWLTTIGSLGALPAHVATPSASPVEIRTDWVRGAATVSPGSSEKLLTSESAGPFRRSFRLHVPADFDPARSYPLVVALHGGLATARIFEKQSDLSAAADRHGFFVVYPNGMGIFSLFRHWNGGYCCARAQKIALDDPGFLDRVRSWVSEHYPIDPEKHFVIGYSNGGMLAYWYAATRSRELAGLGIWASSIADSGGSTDRDPTGSWQMPWPDVPVPALIAHGMDDPKLPFDIDSKSGAESSNELPRQLLGGVGSARAWAGANGCSTEGTDTRSELPVTAESPVLVTTFCPEDPRRTVRLIAVPGWKHDWPGPKFTDRLAPGEPLRGYDLAEEMWRFFATRNSDLGSP